MSTHSHALDVLPADFRKQLYIRLDRSRHVFKGQNAKPMPHGLEAQLHLFDYCPLQAQAELALATSPEALYSSSCSADQSVNAFNIDSFTIVAATRSRCDVCNVPNSNPRLYRGEDPNLRFYHLQSGQRSKSELQTYFCYTCLTRAANVMMILLPYKCKHQSLAA